MPIVAAAAPAKRLVRLNMSALAKQVAIAKPAATNIVNAHTSPDPLAVWQELTGGRDPNAGAAVAAAQATAASPKPDDMTPMSKVPLTTEGSSGGGGGSAALVHAEEILHYYVTYYDAIAKG